MMAALRSALRASIGLGLLASLALGVASCGDRELPPRGQLVVYVDTDAPLPEEPGTVALVPPLFDRLSFELFLPGETEPCRGCARELQPTREGAKNGTLSIGVLPMGATSLRGALRLRVRLFRSKGLAARPASTIEATIALPEIPNEGLVDVVVTLPVAKLAAPQGDLAAPIVATLGRPRAGFAGSFHEHEPRPCVGEPGPNEACVEGAGFWMGDPTLDRGAKTDFDGEAERLAIVAPFFLDKHELTVGELRAIGITYLDDPSDRVTGKIVGCTYARDGSGEQNLPVNCISWTEARAACRKLGRDLPTETELELAAGGNRGSTFPWGDDPPTCEDASFSRSANSQPDCRRGEEVRPGVGGTTKRDRIAARGGELVDLGGNLSEWARDRWNQQDEPCWGSGIFRDPFCDAESPSLPGARSMRGGYFSGPAGLMKRARRGRIVNEKRAVAAEVGFRCMRPGK